MILLLLPTCPVRIIFRKFLKYRFNRKGLILYSVSPLPSKESKQNPTSWGEKCSIQAKQVKIKWLRPAAGGGGGTTYCQTQRKELCTWTCLATPATHDKKRKNHCCFSKKIRIISQCSLLHTLQIILIYKFSFSFFHSGEKM